MTTNDRDDNEIVTDQDEPAKIEVTGEIGKPPEPLRRRAMIEWPNGT